MEIQKRVAQIGYKDFAEISGIAQKFGNKKVNLCYLPVLIQGLAGEYKYIKWGWKLHAGVASLRESYYDRVYEPIDKASRLITIALLSDYPGLAAQVLSGEFCIEDETIPLEEAIF